MKFVLAVVMVVACAHRAAPPPPEPSSPAPAPLARMRPPPAPPAKPGSSITVSGCNSDCQDCSLGDYHSFVVGTNAGTGQRLFPAEVPPKPSYSCGSDVAVGETVTLRATSSSGLEIADWRPFNTNDYCPCQGSATNVCTIEVTAELVASHARVYCGAVWRKHRASLAR